MYDVTLKYNILSFVFCNTIIWLVLETESRISASQTKSKWIRGLVHVGRHLNF